MLITLGSVPGTNQY